MPLGKSTGIESILLHSLNLALTQVDAVSQDNQPRAPTQYGHFQVL